MARKKRGTGLSKGFPKLDDLKRQIPKGGLLSPSLRKGGVKITKATKIKPFKI